MSEFKQTVIKAPTRIQWLDSGEIEVQMLGVVPNPDTFNYEEYEDDDNIFYYVGVKDYLNISSTKKSRQIGGIGWEVYYATKGKEVK